MLYALVSIALWFARSALAATAAREASFLPPLHFTDYKRLTQYLRQQRQENKDKLFFHTLQILYTKKNDLCFVNYRILYIFASNLEWQHKGLEQSQNNTYQTYGIKLYYNNVIRNTPEVVLHT